jgi:hypothetical protein
LLYWVSVMRSWHCSECYSQDPNLSWLIHTLFHPSTCSLEWQRQLLKDILNTNDLVYPSNKKVWWTFIQLRGEPSKLLITEQRRSTLTCCSSRNMRLLKISQ